MEPSTSARAVIGEKQYEAYVGDTGFRAAMANVQDADEAKAVKQSLAGVDLGSESYAEALMDPSHPSRAARAVPCRCSYPVLFLALLLRALQALVGPQHDAGQGCGSGSRC